MLSLLSKLPQSCFFASDETAILSSAIDGGGCYRYVFLLEQQSIQCRTSHTSCVLPSRNSGDFDNLSLITHNRSRNPRQGTIKTTRTPSKPKIASLDHDDCVMDDVPVSSNVVAERRISIELSTKVYDKYVQLLLGSNMATIGSTLIDFVVCWSNSYAGIPKAKIEDVRRRRTRV
jgi:hypothetical protein